MGIKLNGTHTHIINYVAFIGTFKYGLFYKILIFVYYTTAFFIVGVEFKLDGLKEEIFRTVVILDLSNGINFNESFLEILRTAECVYV